VPAAADFAAALYPEAATAVASFYESRAVFAITRVAPAMALSATGSRAIPRGITRPQTPTRSSRGSATPVWSGPRRCSR
jgi:hypothetical protein